MSRFSRAYVSRVVGHTQESELVVKKPRTSLSGVNRRDLEAGHRRTPQHVQSIPPHLSVTALIPHTQIARGNTIDPDEAALFGTTGHDFLLVDRMSLTPTAVTATAVTTGDGDSPGSPDDDSDNDGVAVGLGDFNFLPGTEGSSVSVRGASQRRQRSATASFFNQQQHSSCSSISSVRLSFDG